MKKIILLILIALSVLVTLYLNKQRVPVSVEARVRLETALAKDPRFPARPVWWQDGAILAVGMIADGEPKDKAAEDVCALLRRQQINKTAVEIYDLLRIQQQDEWTLIGKAPCQ